MKRSLFAVCMFSALGALNPFLPEINSQVINSFDRRGVNLCGSPEFTGRGMIEQAVSNTARLDPLTYNLILSRARQRILSVTPDTIGTQNQFFVYNFKSKSFNTVNAILKARGTLTEIWVDKAELLNGHVDDNVVFAVEEALENRTPATSGDPGEGIVALEESRLGIPPNSGLSNSMVHFLVTDVIDEWDSTASGSSYIAGFFQPNDQPDPVNGSYHSASNKRDLLYIDSYPGIYYNGTRDAEAPMSTVAHELQHLIHWHYDPSEVTFLNEGCSTIAEVLCGYPLRSPSLYFRNTNINLFTWHDNTDNTVLADYSRAAIFTLYLADQFGYGFLKSLVQNPLHGIDGLNSSLIQNGVGLGFGRVFRNWIIANRLNDTLAGRQYGYGYPIFARPTPSNSFSDPNVCHSADTTASLTGGYISFTNGDSLIVSYGSTGLDISAIEEGDHPNVRELPASGTFYEPSFGDEYSHITFALVNAAGAGDGTISLTGSGAMSSVESELFYDRGVPDTLDGVTFLQNPDNFPGSGLAVCFAPQSTPYKLIGARIYAAFPQEFSGSTAPPGSPKEFTFHVWQDMNGMPGPDLITPFAVRVLRSQFDDSFIDVDLTSYSPELSNLNGKIYIGFTDEASLKTSAGLCHPVNAGHSFARYSATGSWQKLSDLTFGGSTSLKGWDLMMRAMVAMRTDSLPGPRLLAGIRQDSIQTNRFNVILHSDSTLRCESICASIADAAVEVQLGFSSTSPTRFVSSEAVLTADGRTTVRLKAARLLGANYTDTTFSFVSARIGSADVTLRSRDSLLVIVVPGSSRNFTATLCDGTIDSIDDRARFVYTLGPRDETVGGAAQITVATGTFDTTAFAPAIFHGSKWYGLPFRLVGEFLTASTTLLSTFAVVPRELITGSLGSLVPKAFALRQNYPNPFNMRTTIEFDLPRDSHVSIRIFDVLGREVATIADGFYRAGSYPVVFDATRRGLASGVYFFNIKTNDNVASGKMVLLK